MTATEIQSLFSESKCYACFGPVQESTLLTLALLRRWLLTLNPSADVSAQGLVSYSNCFACFNVGNCYTLIELALLDQISKIV